MNTALMCTICRVVGWCANISHLFTLFSCRKKWLYHSTHGFLPYKYENRRTDDLSLQIGTGYLHMNTLIVRHQRKLSNTLCSDRKFNFKQWSRNDIYRIIRKRNLHILFIQYFTILKLKILWLQVEFKPKPGVAPLTGGTFFTSLRTVFSKIDQSYIYLLAWLFSVS